MPFSQPHKGEGLQCALGNGNQPNSRTTHRVVELACPTLTKGIQRKIQLMYFCLQKRTWNPKLRAGWRNQREVDPDCSCSQRPLPLDSHRGCFYKHVMAHAAALTTGLGLLWFQPPAQPRAALLFPWVLRRCARSHPTLSPHPPPVTRAADILHVGRGETSGFLPLHSCRPNSTEYHLWLSAGMVRNKLGRSRILIVATLKTELKMYPGRTPRFS